jgi:putative inorganic carbon (HCO3(-)) transporter
VQGIGVTSLVLPHFINNQSIGITQGRSRGPFLASDALGLALFDCAVFSTIALTIWRRPLARWACYAVIAMAVPGIIFTLTRSVWIGSIVGMIGAMLWQRRLRRLLPVVLVGGAVVIIVTLVAVPGLSTKANTRASDASSVWDRYNTNHAALRMAEQDPIFGHGWQTFATDSTAFFREAGTYPLTGDGLEVHNVFLSHLAELGLVGSALWTLTLLSGVGGSILRRGPPELGVWRTGMLAIFLMFLVVANLGPLSYAFPNLMLWLTAGIVAVERNSVARAATSPGPQPPESNDDDLSVSADDHVVVDAVHPGRLAVVGT